MRERINENQIMVGEKSITAVMPLKMNTANILIKSKCWQDELKKKDQIIF